MKLKINNSNLQPQRLKLFKQNSDIMNLQEPAKF